MILIDANNIAYIAFHSLGDLSEGEERTGTIFGFLNIVNRIASQFGPSMVFCFDSKTNNRKSIDPTYKANRHVDLENDDLIELNLMHKQLTKLRKEVLPQMGFKNVKVKPGYEADDIIAHYVKRYRTRRITIVSTDKDLYQLLNVNVKIYNPKTKKIFTEFDFEKQYGIHVKDWVRVKAMAGDSADNIKGVYGIGEKTAIKFINGQLSVDSKAYENIKTHWETIKANEVLIKLPLLGGRTFKFKYNKNQLTKEKFGNTFDELRFIYYLKEQQFSKWCENFNLK